MKIAPRSTRPNNMMTRRKLSGLDCIKFFYLQTSVGFIVTEESKIEMRDLDHAKTRFKIRDGRNCGSLTRVLRSLLAKQLVQELVQYRVTLHADHRIGLAIGMNNGGGCLVYVVHAAQRQIFLDQRIQRAAFYEDADFVHLRRRQDGCDGAVYVS